MPRRAFTLMETLVAVTFGSVVLAIAVGMLHTLMRAEQTGRDRSARAGVLARLAEQFRTDMAAAIRPIDVPGNPTEWQFDLGDKTTVTYRSLPGEVQREEQAAGKPVHRESYRLADDQKAAIAIDKKGRWTMAELVVSSEKTPTIPGREVRFAARLGKDRRFTQPGAGSQ